MAGLTGALCWVGEGWPQSLWGGWACLHILEGTGCWWAVFVSHAGLCLPHLFPGPISPLASGLAGVGQIWAELAGLGGFWHAGKWAQTVPPTVIL